MSIRLARWWGWVLPVALALAARAHGQAFNINCGDFQRIGPSSTYGAGAGQSGYWNSDFSNVQYDIAGNLTSVHVVRGGNSEVHLISAASPDDAALMQSMTVLNPDGIGGFSHDSILGLAPGWYDVFVYCWGGQIFGSRTVGIGVGWSDGSTSYTRGASVTFDSVWPGHQVEGVTFAHVPLYLPPNLSLQIAMGGGGNYNVLNGLQLVPIPAPGAAGLLLGACLVTLQRRRKGDLPNRFRVTAQ